jgi:hypothetical protein
MVQGVGIRRFIGRLILASLVIGFLSTLSYATPLHDLLRRISPHAAAWWYASEFYFMEGAATALGLLVALQVGLRLAADAEVGRRLAIAALILDAVLIVPLTNLCARVARIGSGAEATASTGRLIERFGFVTAKILDMVLAAGVYFLKTAGFGFLLGLGLVGAVMAGVILSLRGREVPAQSIPADS